MFGLIYGVKLYLISMYSLTYTPLRWPILHIKICWSAAGPLAAQARFWIRPGPGQNFQQNLSSRLPT